MAVYKVMLESDIHYWSITIFKHFNQYADELNKVTIARFRNDHRDLDRHEYHVFVSKETLEEAFTSGAKLIKEFISK